MPNSSRPAITRESCAVKNAISASPAPLTPTKDQSYFLFTLGQAELARTLFPLGAMTKPEVRDYARRLGLRNADKAESQEICFVPDNDYARFVEQAAAQAPARAGRVVDDSGRVLGSHRGVHHFTVGQRRGLGIAAGAPLYVRELRAASAEVVVAQREALASRGLVAAEVRLISTRDGYRRANSDRGENPLPPSGAPGDAHHDRFRSRRSALPRHRASRQPRTGLRLLSPR